MLTVDITLIIQLANFLLILYLLNVLLYRPIRKILGRRGEEMKSLQDTIADLQNTSARYGKDLEEGMVSAKKTGLKEKENSIHLALGEEKEMLREASSSAGQKLSQVKKEIEHAVLGARQSLEKEMALFSKEMAEKILGRSI